jgi:predicted nucleic acid-binding protein
VKALLDTNVILDHLLEREPFTANAKRIWQACARGEFTGFISPITPVNVFYIARKLRSVNQARKAVEQLLTLFEVCPLDGSVLKAAMLMPIIDFEDAVQCASAVVVSADAIVTRDTNDFARSGVNVLSPADFLIRLAS